MKRSVQIKRYWILVMLMLLAVPGIVYLAKHLIQITASRTTSYIYDRYADRDDLLVSYVKDYRLNDTLAIDVTLIQALDTTRWGELLQDFSYTEPPDNFRQRFYQDTTIVSVSLCSKTNPSMGIDSVYENNNVVVVSYAKHTISVFDVTDPQDLLSVEHTILEQSIE